MSLGRRYKSDYFAILSWVIKEIDIELEKERRKKEFDRKNGNDTGPVYRDLTFDYDE